MLLHAGHIIFNLNLYMSMFANSACIRWDLAGYLTLGGEGNTYDMRIISKLAQEAEKLSETLDVLGKEGLCATPISLRKCCCYCCRNEIFRRWGVDLCLSGESSR